MFHDLIFGALVLLFFFTFVIFIEAAVAVWKNKKPKPSEEIKHGYQDIDGS